MKKPNKRRPDRTRYRRATPSIVGKHKGVARYYQTRGKITTYYYLGLGPNPRSSNKRDWVRWR